MGNTSRVKTTETSFDILELLFEDGPLSLAAVREETGLTTSTAHRHLSTLCERGYAIKKDSKYRISFKFLTFGGDLRRRIPGYPMIKRKVDELAEQTDERAQFIIQEGIERVYIYTEIGNNPVQTGAHTGTRGAIYSSAAGKSIVAHLSQQKRENLLDSVELHRTGPNTITDPADLREELDLVRERGYALNLEETTGGVHAIGAPIKGHDSEIIGALSVSGPATRLKSERLEDDILDLVLAATNELELHIEHS
jgi:DNA-binding IclR family transcriptional regulator